jgi:hypothetical protein
MSIEVRCPNPDCAGVHKVKNKYAGMRGKCPDCGTWMLIPRLAPASRSVPAPAEPRLAVDEPSALADEPTIWSEPEGGGHAAPRPRHPVEDETTLWMEPEETAVPKSGPAVGRKEAEAFAEEEGVEVADEAEIAEEAEEADLEEPAAPARHFSWVPVILLGIGILGVAAICTTPYIGQPSATLTGDLPKMVGGRMDVKAYKEDFKIFVLAVPAAVAVVALLGLLAAAFTRQYSIIPLFTTYLAWLASMGLVLMAFANWDARAKDIKETEKLIASFKQHGTVGDATVSMGYYVWIALAGALAGALLFALAIFLMHKRRVSRIIFIVVFLLASLAVGGIVAAGMSGK